MLLEEVPVFRPTEEEFTSGFIEYINKIEPLCIKYGLAKIIPPASWNQREKDWHKKVQLTIPSPIQQYVKGIKGVYQQTNVVLKPKTLTEFMECANKALSSRNATTDEEIERRFWKHVRYEAPIYGADMLGSIFPPSLEHWNVAKLDSLLNYLDAQVQGVNTAYLYFGMWKAMFAWHTEDMDLFSINYLHFGEPKKWYCIPSAERSKFEEVAREYFGESYKECPEFLRHKTSLISPSLLRSKNISVYTMVQREREIMITFPGSYHCGFNHGFNCAESVNFANETWIQYGIKARYCQCRDDTVRIFMKNFIERYKLMSNRDVQRFEDMISEQKDQSFYLPFIEDNQCDEGDQDYDGDLLPDEEKSHKGTARPNKRKRFPVNKEFPPPTRSKRIKPDPSSKPPPFLSLSSLPQNLKPNLENQNQHQHQHQNQHQLFIPLVDIENLSSSLLPTTCLPSVLFSQRSM